ncbi:Integral membrane protein [Fusarium acuminatum]|uniref:Integral membrane protein n=1 Tax=Fusarium acuminatum TaxID=5515 RepID=A0ABZ2X279_9HYPO
MSTRSSPVQITTYKRPRGLAALVFSGAVLSFISLAGVVFIPDESWIWQIFDDISSGRAESFRWIIKTGVPPLVVIHTIEAIAFDRTRLMRHGVPRWGLLWWKWVLTCWVEGFTCWQRFASVITTKQARH